VSIKTVGLHLTASRSADFRIIEHPYGMEVWIRFVLSDGGHPEDDDHERSAR
jgi:hypothetical protein